MPSASLRTELIVFQRATVTTNDYGEEISTWADYATRRARVRFGTAQEKREAAQESASQTATFECVRSAELDAVTLGYRISYLGDAWDITEQAPLDRATIRFTAVRLVS
jgi:SPP1 family predicted phage head-tail adaptor